MIVQLIRALLAFSFVAILVLIASGYRKDAGAMHLTTEINTSPEKLWPWLEDGDRAKQWVGWLVEVRKAPQGSPPVGSKEVWVMRDENNSGKLMEVTGTCTEYTPYTRIGVHLSTPGEFEGDQTYRLTDLGGNRTSLDVDARFRFETLFARLLEPFITPSARRKMEVDMGRLKTLVESLATPPTSAR
jgi:uncharacterized protein YndB with AHSA1/START domain